MEILYVYIYEYILIIITLWFLYTSFVASCLRPVPLHHVHSSTCSWFPAIWKWTPSVLYVLVCCYIIWTHRHTQTHTYNATNREWFYFCKVDTTDDATTWHSLSFWKSHFFSPSHRFILTDKHGLRTQRPVCGALITGLNQCDLQGKRRVKSKLYATSWIGFRNLKQGSNRVQTVLIQAIHFIFCFVRVKTAKQPAYFASESSGAMQVWCGVKGKNLTRNMLYLYIKCKVYPLC